jgi:phage gp36-like protein
MYIQRSDISHIISNLNLVKLTNEGTNLQIADETVIEKLINYCNSFIDDSLRGKYNLPLNSIPEVLKDIAAGIFIFKIYERKVGTPMSDEIQKRYDNALSNLKNYTSGNFLQLPKEAQIGKVSYSTISYKEKKFTNEILNKF